MNQNLLIRSFLFYAFGPVGRGFLGLISLTCFSWIISPEDFGKVSLFLSATIILSVISIAGLNQAFARDYHEQQDKSSLFYHCLMPAVIISILLAILILLFRNEIAIFLFQQDDIFSVIALSITIILAAPHILSMSALEMEQKATLTSIILIVWRLLEFVIGIVLLLYWKNSYQSLIIAQFFSFTITTIWLVFVAKKYWVIWIPLNIKLLKKIFSFSIPLTVSRTLMLLTGYVNLLFIKHWSSIQEVGIYEVAAKIAFSFIIVRSAIERFWIPTQYRFLSNGENETNYHVIIEVISSSLLLTFVLLVLSRSLITSIIGPQFSPSCQIFIFMLYANANYIFMSIISYGIHFSRKTYKVIGISIFSIIINFTLLSYLIPSYGAKGAAITFALTSLFYFLGTAFIVRQVWQGVKLLEILKDSFLMGVLIILTFLGKPYEIAMVGLIITYKYRFILNSFSFLTQQIKKYNE